MNRRGFLSGVFGGITSAGLILRASPSEIEAFASPLVPDQPLMMNIPSLTAVGQELYNKHGDLVAYVSHIEVLRPNLEVTMAGDSHRKYMPSVASVHIQAVGVGPLTWEDGLPALGGRRR
jgi:hypothetical protein